MYMNVFPHLRYVILLFLCMVFVKTIQGQFIREGIVYGKTGGQRIERTFVDNEGNVFHSFVNTGDTIIVDSLGVPIKIIPNFNGQNGIVLIKFNKFGIYQFVIYLESGVSWAIDIKFTPINDAIITYSIFTGLSSARLFDAKGRLFRDLQFLNAAPISNEIAVPSLVVCKLNTEGEFLWANGISMLNLPKQLGGNFGRTSMAGINEVIINKKKEIKLLYSIIKTDTAAVSDTLVLTNNQNQQSYHVVRGPYIMLTFSDAGDMLSINQPFKNSFKQVQQDSTVYFRVTGLTTDGVSSYGIVRFSITKQDTFGQTPLVPSGYNFIVKFNENDSLLWSKPISKELQRWYYQITKFNYDSNAHQLALAVPYDPYYFEFMLNPSFNINFSGSYICKLTTNGDLISDMFLNANDDRIAVTNFAYNSFNKTHVISGYTHGNELKLQQHLPANPLGLPMAFMAQMDSSNHIITAEPITGSNKFLDETIILTNKFFISKPSSSMVDRFGRVFISGWFRSDILLPCDTLEGNGDLITGRTEIAPDGFMLIYYPLVYKDTNVCNSMLSPSGKYVWSNTGLYSDTINGSYGCDSILFFKMVVKSSSSELDTIVCNPIKSFSNKYLWDTTGTYFDTIPNVYGCDSIIKINVKIRKSSSEIDTTVKDSLVAPSLRYTWMSSGIYFDTLVNIHGCDSIIILKLKVLNSRVQIDTFNCNPIQYLSHEGLITATGIYRDTLVTMYAGDSIITIRFTLGKSESRLDTVSCDNIISPSGKYIWQSTGLYTDTLLNSSNCDSIITVNFVKLTTISSINYTICDSLISPSGRYIYRNTGIYYDTIPSSHGCDSLMVLNIHKTQQELNIIKSNDIDCENKVTELSIEDFAFEKLIWSPNNNIDNLEGKLVKVNPKESTTYYITATDTLGCIYNDSILVLVNAIDSIGFFPNVFTPNNDGANDCLPINSMARLLSVDFVVFNRWGDKVFETTNTNLCWRGITNNGEELPVGVYYYILNGKTECDQSVNFHGSITIIR